MLIQRCEHYNIKLKYVKSLDEDHYTIVVKETFPTWVEEEVVCDCYDVEWIWKEIVSLDNGEKLVIISPDEIEDCPTLKWFYIVRE